DRGTILCASVRIRRSWLQAEDFCQTWGGHLVSIQNQADQNRLDDYVRSPGEIWIGFNDRDQEGQWRWVGRESDYRRWGNGQPDNWGPGEDCAAMWNRVNGRWNDAICSQPKAFLCER
ncbi:MAG TPA: hypothetical protein DEB46_12480, partial [Myxococcales bacterium]|nr:hypothetical protein [Myxococcales bacterium]